MEQFTGNVSEDKEFITKNGKKIRNIYELYDIVYQMEDYEFSHHVGSDKNDFQNWILHVITDQKLASTIAEMKTKESILNALEKRIDHYNKKKIAYHKENDAAVKGITEVALDESFFTQKADAALENTKAAEEKPIDAEVIQERAEEAEKIKDASDQNYRIIEQDQAENILDEKEEDVKSILKAEKEERRKRKKKGNKKQDKEKEETQMPLAESHSKEKIRLYGEYDFNKEKTKEFLVGLVFGIIIGLIIAKLLAG